MIAPNSVSRISHGLILLSSFHVHERLVWLRLVLAECTSRPGLAPSPSGSSVPLCEFTPRNLVCPVRDQQDTRRANKCNRSSDHTTNKIDVSLHLRLRTSSGKAAHRYKASSTTTTTMQRRLTRARPPAAISRQALAAPSPNERESIGTFGHDCCCCLLRPTLNKKARMGGSRKGQVISVLVQWGGLGASICNSHTSNHLVATLKLLPR